MDEVTAAQAAGLTGLSERTIRRRIAAGMIPARHVAPNRYAINVRDLPVHHSADELAARIEALEHRVRLIELRQAALLATSPAADAALDPAETGYPAMQAPPAVRELLAALVNETERLTSLLMPAAGEEPSGQASRRRSGRRSPTPLQKAQEG
ncbi:MAG TPA: hypothetical protein VGS80_25965 [Ktedonobacterales bacterium]|nr:hypothetical protein [Ktedonobacterales bacterium]